VIMWELASEARIRRYGRQTGLNMDTYCLIPRALVCVGGHIAHDGAFLKELSGTELGMD